MHPLSGQTIGAYTIIKAVGSGGMSTVYEASDTKLQRKVAVKLLHPHLLENKMALKRFKREAMAAAKMDHPNIVRIYDYVQTLDQCAIIMEFVPGRDMESIVKGKGRLSFETASFVMEQIALALRVAHEQGIIHRDVKPSNIVIHQNDRVMLTDFGLAHHFADRHLTVTDSVISTKGKGESPLPFPFEKNDAVIFLRNSGHTLSNFEIGHSLLASRLVHHSLETGCCSFVRNVIASPNLGEAISFTVEEA